MVKIVTDSACDLPANVTEALDITVVPSRILFGRRMYEDGALSKDDFYSMLKDSYIHPLTTPASPQRFYSEFQQLEAEGEDIIYISISKKLSQFYDSARLALEHITEVKTHLYDTANVSLGQGLLAVQAARLAEMGYNIGTIVDKLETIKERSKMYAAAKVFKYLIRSGRVNVARGIAGSVLGISPVVMIDEGLIEEAGKPFGQVRAIDIMIKHLEYHFSREEELLVGMMQIQNPGIAASLSYRVQELFNVHELINSRIGPTIGANIGPGAVGVAAVPVLEELL